MSCNLEHCTCGYLTGGHFGRDKTYNKIASCFYWSEWAGEVREYVVSCDICQRTNDGGKFVKATAPLHPIKVEPEVWRMVCQEHVDVTLLLLCMVTIHNCSVQACSRV